MVRGRRNEKLEALRAHFLALVEVARQVRGASARGGVGAPDLAEYDSWRELGSCTQQAQLRQLTRDFLVEWNEGVGADVEAFWRLAAERGLDVERKQDVVVDTLRRGRILNPPQFYELDDHFEEQQTCGKIDRLQAEALKRMLDDFEADPKSFDWVSSR